MVIVHHIQVIDKSATIYTTWTGMHCLNVETQTSASQSSHTHTAGCREPLLKLLHSQASLTNILLLASDQKRLAGDSGQLTSIWLAGDVHYARHEECTGRYKIHMLHVYFWSRSLHQNTCGRGTGFEHSIIPSRHGNDAKRTSHPSQATMDLRMWPY